MFEPEWPEDDDAAESFDDLNDAESADAWPEPTSDDAEADELSLPDPALDPDQITSVSVPDSAGEPAKDTGDGSLISSSEFASPPASYLDAISLPIPVSSGDSGDDEDLSRAAARMRDFTAAPAERDMPSIGDAMPLGMPVVLLNGDRLVAEVVAESLPGLAEIARQITLQELENRDFDAAAAWRAATGEY